MNFDIGLQAAQAFDFYVDAYGVMPGAVNSAIRLNQLQAATMNLSIPDEFLVENEEDATHEIYMPVITQ